MRVEIPLLVEQQKEADQAVVFSVRPLFFQGPARSGERLDRVLNRMTNDVRDYFNTLSRRLDHRPLLDVLLNPPLETVTVRAQLVLRRQTLRGKWLAITFRVGETKVAFVTEYPDFWFVVSAGQKLEDRVIEVLTAEATRREKENQPLPTGLNGKVWVTPATVNITAKQQIPKEKLDFAAMFEAAQIGSGAEELHRVGRSIDALYPDGLEYACLREKEVQELTQLLQRKDRPSVLLVGPSGVGKTTLVHEYVRQRLLKEGKGSTAKNNTWMISPQRLISGMSYVGQWEERLLAILKHVGKQDHALLVDDVVGLFSAGRTSQSDLSVGHVLKPFVERRDVRLIGEITPEALRALREIDRGFADLFHVMHLREPDATTSRRMLIAQMRQIEDQQRCRFDLEVLPTALDLTRRYVGGVSFPGKAAGFLAQLASKQKGKAVERQDVIDAFHERSGLPRSYMDDQEKLARQTVIEKVSQRVIGQVDAIEAVADVVCVGKARLSAPDRPLGSLLFLGPTGVGKTQLAKSLAAFLYGRTERLLRFDMNSFNDASAALRLVGTFREPDGQLTAAIRRQPFSVVLFDEIEKAHPNVHDLLLQVLGEGRLTDALGRTADFTNAIIVLTSNLGVREASQRLGFKVGDGTADSANDEVYAAAARSFFRPELFNRFDRIVPFQMLSRDETAKVAEILMQDILQREGLGRRRSILRVSPAATQHIIERGYDAHFGARAMRRALERELNRPIAVRLAGLPSDASVLIDVLCGPETLDVVTTPLRPAPRQAWPPKHLMQMDRSEIAERALATLARIEETAISQHTTTSFVSGGLDAQQLSYLALKEEISDTRRKAENLAKYAGPRPMKTRSNVAPRQRRGIGAGPPTPPKPRTHWHEAPQDVWGGLLQADEASFYLKQIVNDTNQLQAEQGIPGELLDLLAQLAWLEAVAKSMVHEDGKSVCLVLRCLSSAATDSVDLIGKRLTDAFGLPWGIDAKWYGTKPDDPADQPGVLTLSGVGSTALAQTEAGTHVHVDSGGNLLPVQAIAVQAESPQEAIAAVQEAEKAWSTKRTNGEASLKDRPWPVGPIHRIIESKGTMVDLRSGLMTPVSDEPYDVMAFVLSQLPLPNELSEGEI